MDDVLAQPEVEASVRRLGALLQEANALLADPALKAAVAAGWQREFRYVSASFRQQFPHALAGPQGDLF